MGRVDLGAAPTGLRRGRLYVGKGCFAGYKVLFNFSYSYMGPGNLMVYSAVRDEPEWHELAAFYQNEGLGPGGDPFATNHPGAPMSKAHVYRFRIRKIEDFLGEMVLFCHLVASNGYGEMGPGLPKRMTYMFNFDSECASQGGGEAVHILIPKGGK